MKKLVILSLIFLFIILCVIICTLIVLQNRANNTVEPQIIVDPKTKIQVLEKYNVEYIKEEENHLYVVFNKDLFDDNGESNEKYFNDIIEELKKFYKEKTFYLIDEEKDINIKVQYRYSIEDFVVTINDIEDFFNQTDGDIYSKVDDLYITRDSSINVNNDYLVTLNLNSMYISAIEDELGEGKDIENNYKSYFDGIIKIRTVGTEAVRNIIFSDKYEGNITSNLKVDMSLREIYEMNSDNVFGSLEDKYLGYKDADYYLFFYGDEVSVYSYAYEYNKVFEEQLEKYLQDDDLNTFVNKITNAWETYDYYEYNPETGDAYILYSNRGLEINIKDNDPKGITLYSNYYLTEDTARYVKNGQISLNYKEDLVDKIEKERRAGTLKLTKTDNE